MDKIFTWGRPILILSRETSLGHLVTSGEVKILLLDVSVDKEIIFWRIESKEAVRKHNNFIGNINNRYWLS